MIDDCFLRLKLRISIKVASVEACSFDMYLCLEIIFTLLVAVLIPVSSRTV